MSNDLTTEKPLELLAQEADDLEESINQDESSIVIKGLRQGAIFLAAKEQLPHGKFQPWLKERRAPARRAQIYMKACRRYLERGGSLSLPELVEAKCDPGSHLPGTTTEDSIKKLAAPKRSGNATPKKKEPPTVSGNDVKPEPIPNAQPTPNAYDELVEVMKDGDLKLHHFLTQPQLAYLLKEAKRVRLERTPL